MSVTLYQALSVTMTLESDMDGEQLCAVLTAALTLEAFDHTCAATSDGSGTTTFLLEYPLENNLAAGRANRNPNPNPNPNRNPNPYPNPNP